MKKFILKILSAFLLISGAFLIPQNAYAEPLVPGEESPSESTDEDTEDEDAPSEEETAYDTCVEKTGSLSWIVCPGTGLVATITDELYNAIEDLLIVQPLPVSNVVTNNNPDESETTETSQPTLGTTMDTSPIYLVWQYARSFTNVVFIIFLIITIYSQITGAGINNYGIKRILPRLIIAIILVNLSYIICALAVDVSNIVGGGLRDIFTEIENKVIAGSAEVAPFQDISLDGVLATVLTGGSIGLVAMGAVGGPGYIFFMLLIVLLGALVAVVSGLITIAARQALVSLLVMISPLAFVAYLLPNTEKWFTQWRQLLTRMLVFYPLFSFLFGASHLLGFALLASATSPAGILLGIAVQIFPLFFSWSLMKMSGTILGNLNTGIRKLAAPLQSGFSKWALSHAEQKRQDYIAHSTTTGAHLRRYLDERQAARIADTENSAKARANYASRKALEIQSSYLGLDEDGKALYSSRPNRYTINAKIAAESETRAGTGQALHKNTMSAYGRHFGRSVAATALSAKHADAFEEAMVQSYLAKNEAQADEDYLLDRYLKAAEQGHGSYEFNRLITNAAGSLGAKGEASIMGQVIVANSTTENRRRTEARIVFTKFPIDKKEFRAFLLDMAHVNDNGYETDEWGNELEDEHYKLKSGAKHQQWNHYIGRHKVTGDEITRDEYDRLSDAERANYTRIKYIDIKDDKGNLVQRVYDDDAGYMKELLADDILIGDPINNRYNALIGAGDEIHSAGILRKYHSVVSTNMNTSGYKTHDATITPMVTAQTNMGYVNSPYHLNLARLQSFNVASKAGPFLQNDGVIIDGLTKLLSAAADNEIFSDYYPDEEIMTYKNVNGFHLKGLKRRKNKDTGELEDAWDEVGFKEIDDLMKSGEANKVLEYRKEYIKHSIVSKAITKAIGIVNRNISPGVLENQKPDTLKSLMNLVDVLTELATENNDTSKDFTDRIDTTKDFFESYDPTILKRMFGDAIRKANADGPASQAPQTRQQLGGTPIAKQPRSSASTSASNLGNVDLSQAIAQAVAQAISPALAQFQARAENYNQTHDFANISDTVAGWGTYLSSLSELQDEATQLFNENPYLSGYADSLQQIFDDIANQNRPTTPEEAADRLANPLEYDSKTISQAAAAIQNLINQIPRP